MTSFSLCLSSPFSICLPLKLSPSQGQTSFLPTPSLTYPPSLAARGKKDQWREEGREEKKISWAGWGKNEVGCAEEQMEEAVGDWAWADTSRKNLKGSV